MSKKPIISGFDQKCVGGAKSDFFIKNSSSIKKPVLEFFHSLQLSKKIMPESEQMSLTWTTHKVSTVIQFVAGLVAFSIVYFVASSNPQGFMIILERLASACLNMTNSIFLRTMIVVGL